MSKIWFITDSSARFDDKNFVEDNPIKIVPMRVQLGKSTHLDGVNIDAEEMFRRVQQHSEFPSVTAPTVQDYVEVIKRVAGKSRRICIVTNSKHFSQSFANAKAAAGSYLGRCEIALIDSGTTSVCQAYMVESLMQSAKEGLGIEEIEREARFVASRLYCVFYVDSLDYIERIGLLEKTQSILGAMLEIKPLITIEDGEFITMEKARTHSQAIDKLVEFVAEFSQVEKIAILQSSTRVGDRTRMLQDRLALETGRTHYPVMLYEPLLTAKLGSSAIGVGLIEAKRD